MVAEIVAVLGVIADLAEAHPDIVKELATDARNLLDGHENTTVQHPEALRAIASGLAAMRANAVQEHQRRQRAR